MSIQSKLHPAQFLMAGLLTAISISFITVRSVQAQPVNPADQPFSKVKLAREAEITMVRSQFQQAANQGNFRTGIGCPPNTAAIGGGGEVSPSDVNAYVKASYPFRVSSEPYARVWMIDGINLSSRPVTFNVYAVCAQVKQ